MVFLFSEVVLLYVPTSFIYLFIYEITAIHIRICIISSVILNYFCSKLGCNLLLITYIFVLVYLIDNGTSIVESK